jgi:hypothetical protein
MTMPGSPTVRGGHRPAAKGSCLWPLGLSLRPIERSVRLWKVFVHLRADDSDIPSGCSGPR